MAPGIACASTRRTTAGSQSLVGGDFMEFEGNHNDTEIAVVLKPKAAQSRTGKGRN
jgi:hypothetical protein